MVRTNSITKNEPSDVMNLDELRREIIDRLKEVDDINYLNELHHLVWQVSYGPFDPDPTRFTPKRKIINEALEAVKRREHFTQEEEIRDIGKWIEENKSYRQEHAG